MQYHTWVAILRYRKLSIIATWEQITVLSARYVRTEYLLRRWNSILTWVLSTYILAKFCTFVSLFDSCKHHVNIIKYVLFVLFVMMMMYQINKSPFIKSQFIENKRQVYAQILLNKTFNKNICNILTILQETD